MRKLYQNENYNMNTLIIAEAGVNHNGDMNIAEKLINVAFDAGVDIVKFQTFHATELASNFAKKLIIKYLICKKVEHRFQC